MRNMGATRQSGHINRVPASNIHHATRVAERWGTPLNRHVTLNFDSLGVHKNEASRVLQKMLAQRFAPWLRRSGKSRASIRPTYVWTLEAAGNVVSAHWAVHIPRGRLGDFKNKLAAWLREAAGSDAIGGAIKITPIYNITGLKRYILKGTIASYARLCKITHVPQGKIVGKRSGFSKNLGPAARARAGYRPQRIYVTEHQVN
jgi:hypothetical protein